MSLAAGKRSHNERSRTMKRHYLTSVTALALALGMTAAGAQNVDQRRNTDQGRQTDQVERSQQPQTSGQSQNMPSHQQGSDQENRQGTQNQQSGQLPQQNPPGTTGQNATDRQQGDRQPEQRLKSRLAAAECAGHERSTAAGC